MATAPSPNDLTRQQLDELDALLQRMLSVPLTPVDPPPPAPTAGAPTVANWRADPPAPGPAPAPHLAPSDLPRPPARVPRVSITAHPALDLVRVEAPPEPATPAIAARAAPELAPAPVVADEPKALAPPPMAAEVDDEPIITPVAVPSRTAGRLRPPAPNPVVDTPGSSPPAPYPMLLWPAVAFDRAVDRALGALGPPGRLLRSGFGMHLIGLTGVGLLAYTALHVAAERGLVALPVPLPWPR